MGVYIGHVKETNGYYNFNPLAEVRGSQLVELTSADLEDLLPESRKRNINLSYSRHNEYEQDQMASTFGAAALVAFEFVVSELQANINKDGVRNDTGYKVPALDYLEKGRFQPIDATGVYYTVRRTEILSDFKKDAIVEIASPFVATGDHVFLEIEDGFWAGPYEVGYRELTSSFYIKPGLKEKKYTATGYKKNQVYLRELSVSEGYTRASELTWKLIMPRQGERLEQIDVINDEALVESFKESLQNGLTSDGKVPLDDIPALLERYQESVLAGSILTDQVRKARLNRLVDILTSEKDVDETLSTVADFICDLLVKYQESENVEEWIQALVAKHPEWVEQLRDAKAITKKISQMEEQLDELYQQKAVAEAELEETKQKAASIDQAAIEAKKEQYLAVDEEYSALVARRDAMQNIIDGIDNIVDLQKKQSHLEGEVAYLTKHKDHLEHDTAGLELQFQHLISRPHEKMVEIAFDGFMASKMLNAAAEWEAKENARDRAEMLAKVKAVPAVEKTPEELIEYLCRTIQTLRPSYSRNTIINIAVCMTQGFLTVFSGEPGCGKTSICNIFGQVLGLNKVANCIDCSEADKETVRRFVPVSVERGWTSKRDFVGYYNPLSKTFDKSNRRVYDALRQLDAEKRDGVRKLPYVILLDEANLSPMEYYWSDFMNVCDDLSEQSSVNLGENYVFGIPETLHFVATINNDHTTETLSPRLIDRAWIITLPQQYGTHALGSKLSADQVEVIAWSSLCAAFIPKGEDCVFSAEVKKIYDSITQLLRKNRFVVSPRVEKAIKKYWVVAAKWFEMDETKTDAATVAFDYAVAQRILPKIVGHGEPFEKWLEELRSLCSSNGMNMCAAILKDIIERGNQQMKYYQFFG